MIIGVCVSGLTDITRKLAHLAELGVHSCQLLNSDMSQLTEEKALEVLAALEQYDISISTYWAGWSGPNRWNFTEGPLTLGLLPPAYRHMRVNQLKRGADFAKRLGVKQVATHAGFIPENPHDPLYAGMIDALREVAEHVKNNGQYFLFETGQETPVALLRAISDIGTGNLGINLDTANLVLYGKANPVDALDMIGGYVMDLHIKDGFYPTCGSKLGREVPVGEGCVDFEKLIARLKEIGYDGALTIECEISGDAQERGVIGAKKLLEKYI